MIEINKQTTVLNQIRDEIHKNAVDHGWWDEERSFGEIIALCHAELSEALEEYRDGHDPDYIYAQIGPGHTIRYDLSDKTGKPEGIPIELADVIIRILDYCGRHNIDIEKAIRLKHQYNKTRTYRHGNKRI